ncbi:hypothetical protein IT397_03390 [Candidatus Nomurabacteria bacterium]|nr:hypothetical protein [Candidatus Nomurabacteria bacterium]
MKQLLIWVGVGIFLILAILYFDRISSVFENTLTPVFNKSVGIKVFYPKANETISTPFLIEGEALGSWYFEGSFPINLVNENGDVLATGVAKAKSNWMVNDFVPFESRFDYEGGGSGPASFIFSRDNPSGISEYDRSYNLPIIINTPNI